MFSGDKNPHSSIFFSFPSLQLREAMAAMRRSAQDVQKFMDAVHRRTNAQDALKGQCELPAAGWCVLALVWAPASMLPQSSTRWFSFWRRKTQLCSFLFPCWEDPLGCVDSKVPFRFFKPFLNPNTDGGFPVTVLCHPPLLIALSYRAEALY